MCNAPGGLGDWLKWQGGRKGRRVYGVDTHHVQDVGCAISIREVCVMYV